MDNVCGVIEPRLNGLGAKAIGHRGLQAGGPGKGHNYLPDCGGADDLSRKLLPVGAGLLGGQGHLRQGPGVSWTMAALLQLVGPSHVGVVMDWNRMVASIMVR